MGKNVKLNIAQYITEHIRDEFNCREEPRLVQLAELVHNLARSVNANNIGVQNVYHEFKVVKDAMEPVLADLHQKEAQMDDMIRELRYVLKEAKFFQGILSKADEKYAHYLRQLEEDISTYKESDQAVRRLAALEARITMLEQK